MTNRMLPEWPYQLQNNAQKTFARHLVVDKLLRAQFIQANLILGVQSGLEKSAGPES